MVGGKSERGVVTTCSYEARAFGVRSGMPQFQAKKLCPKGVFLPIDMEYYQEASRHIMNLLKTFTTKLQQVSIDEAFLDMQGTQKYIGTPESLAKKIQEVVESATDVTVSIGIASSKYVAKIASDIHKPKGIYRVMPGEEAAFMAERPLKSIWGLGPKGREALARHRITTVKQLLPYSEERLQRIMGTQLGTFLHKAIRGQDPGAFANQKKSASISNETTFAEDTTNREFLEKTLLALSQKVMFRLIESKESTKGMGIKVVYFDRSSWSSHRVGSHRTTSAKKLFTEAKSLLYEKWDTLTPIRLIGVSVEIDIDHTAHMQYELFAEPSDSYDREEALDKVVLALNKKGANLTRAKLMDKQTD